MIPLQSRSLAVIFLWTLRLMFNKAGIVPTSLQRDLKKKQRHMVQLSRGAVGMSDIFGFVVNVTEDLVLVHFFDSEAFCLTGYDVLRQRDIRSYCFFDDPRY